MRVKQRICLFLAAVLGAFGMAAWSSPMPDFKGHESAYYAALHPTEIPPFDYAYYSAQETKPFLLAHPEIAEEIVLRAYLRGAIFWAEGVYPNQYGWKPYDIIVGYNHLQDYVPADRLYEDHPRQLIYIPSINNSSDAAGACQAISTTWDLRHREYPDVWFTDLPSFHPRNQDVFCVVNLWATGGYDPLIEGISVDPQTGEISVNVESFTQSIYNACDEWASFPGPNGRSCLNQGAKTIEDLWANFQKALKEEQAAFVPVRVDKKPEEQTIVPTPDQVAVNPEDLFPDDMKTPLVKGEMIGGYIVTDVRRFRTKNPVTGEDGYNRWHDGGDFGTPIGVELKAPMPGKAVCHLGDNQGFGNYVEFFPQGLDGQSFVFKHLNDCVDMVWDGNADVVPLFGHTGNTGFGTGPHLHMAGWRYVGGQWEHYDYSKGWTIGFLTGKLPQKE